MFKNNPFMRRPAMDLISDTDMEAAIEPLLDARTRTESLLRTLADEINALRADIEYKQRLLADYRRVHEGYAMALAHMEVDNGREA